MNNQSIPCEEAVIEALTLTYEIDEYGTKSYRNKEGQYHRIYGPAVTWPIGIEFWYKNGLCHREDGPAIIYTRNDGESQYYINNKRLTKYRFIQWQKKNGIEPIE